MSLVASPSSQVYDPTPLDEMAVSIRSESIPWEAYQRGRLITTEQLDLIRAYDKKDPYVMDSLLEKHGQIYAKLFLDFLKCLNNKNATQYVVTLIDDMLTANSDRVKLFHSKENDGYPFGPLLKLLEREEDYVVQKANKIITGIICSGAVISNDDFKHYFDWLISKLKSTNAIHLEIAINALMNLLLVPDIRIKFSETSDGIQRLIDILKKQPNFQVKYEVIFCLWLLTFTSQIASKIYTKWNVIPFLVEILRTSIKEKVTRVTLATIRNMIEKAPEDNLQPLADFKVLNICQTLQTRKWTDEDVVSDIQFLIDNLIKSDYEHGSFDEYAAEVRSLKLEWSPPHRSEVFWKQNAMMLNEKDYEILKILARILSTSADPQILAIACHDIGEYVRVYSRGKKIVQQVGAKQRIMELMSDPDPTVRYEALLAVQKFMVTNW
jgi:V-type H+-transporting ATPase subunit H